MNKSLLSARYALALYEYAFEKQADKAIFQALSSLAINWRDYPSLRMAMLDPALDNPNKEKILTVATGSSDPILSDFFRLLIRNERQQFAGRIANSYISLWNEMNHIVTATLQTASDIDDDRDNVITSILSRVIPDNTIRLDKVFYQIGRASCRERVYVLV